MITNTEFLNQVITNLCQLLSVKKMFTSAYRPQANGATERVHRFLNDSVSTSVFTSSHVNGTFGSMLQPLSTTQRQ